MGKTFQYRFLGTCTRSVSFEVDGYGRLHGISFNGGCNGNLQGIASLCDGMTPEEIIAKCKGIRCGFKSTSCPDQFSQALEKYIAERNDSANE